MSTAGPALASPSLERPLARAAATVVRDRLLYELDHATQRPLIVVCAPAGYGKTTAVAQWLGTVRARHARLALDTGHDDPRRLRARLLAALGATTDPAPSRRSDRPSAVTLSAIEALGERVVIVLDDYQVLEHPGCHELVGDLADGLPATTRLVICSRAQPPLRLARRRASGTLAELGPQQLRLDVDEAEELLNGPLGLGLDRDVVAAIVARVDGWPAAIVPAARGDDALTAALADAALDGADPRLREFLRRTSILRRLDGAVCEAVLEDAAARGLVDQAQRDNLVIDDDGAGLRHHRPLAEALERELRTAEPQLLPVLHRRAAAWFATAGSPEEASRHASAAGDGEGAAELLLRGWRDLVLERRHRTVRRLIAALPADRGGLTGVCEALDVLCLLLEDTDPGGVSERVAALDGSPEVAPVLDVVRVSHRFGDIGRAVADGWIAWKRAPDIDARAMLAGPFGAVLWLAGERDDVRDVVEPLVSVIGDRAGRTWALASLALAAADDGDPELAEHHARAVIESAEAHGEGVALGRHFGHAALAEALRLGGRLDEAVDELAVATELTRAQPYSVDHAVTLVLAAQLAHARRDRTRMQTCAARARAIIGRHPDLGVLPDRLAGIERGPRRADDDLRGSVPTPAERRVLARLADDLTLEQIAAELYLSIHTVKSHRRRLYKRLAVRSREDALAVARERGLLEAG